MASTGSEFEPRVAIFDSVGNPDDFTVVATALGCTISVVSDRCL